MLMLMLMLVLPVCYDPLELSCTPPICPALYRSPKLVFVRLKHPGKRAGSLWSTETAGITTHAL